MERQCSRFRLAPGALALLWLALLTACDLNQAPAAPEALPAPLETAILTGNWMEVETLATAWMHHPACRRDASILRGYAALARGNAAAAVRHFLRARTGQPAEIRWGETLAARHPDRAVAQLLAGDVLARRGDWQAGLARFDAALALEPELALARVARGLLRALVGEQAEARRDLEALTVAGPLAAEALVARSLVSLGEGRPEQALADLQRALELAPEHAVAYNTLGVVHAQRAAWEAAAQDFQTAFHFAPELVEARQNWQVARRAATQRGAVITEKWHLGVFGTGIQAEADWNYATSHAHDLVPGRPHAFLYVGIKGNLPLAGVEKMTQQGVQTVVVDPRHPQAGTRQIDQFITQSVASGKNPIVFIDINKWAPTQLGNTKATAMALPADLAASANRTFHREVAQRGGQSASTLAGHSDFTWVGTQASILATRQGVPFKQVILESPRSEAGVKEAVRLSPTTQFTVVQPAQGDWFTREAQQRALKLEPGAYRQTIETLKHIDAPNYRLALIENPTPSGPLGIPKAHGDPARYDRLSQLTFWRSGEQIGMSTGALGKLLGAGQPVQPAVAPVLQSTARGGIWLGPVSLARGAGGRLVFGAGERNDGQLTLISTLFGASEATTHAARSTGREGVPGAP